MEHPRLRELRGGVAVGDRERRKAERAALLDGPEDRERAAWASSRHAGRLGPYEHLAGERVLMAGAAWNVYGVLLERVPVQGGARLVLGPAWDGDYDATTFSAAMPIGTPECPVVVHEDHFSYIAKKDLEVIEISQ